MNEQIRLLWEEAAKTTQGDSWEEQTKFLEKFAELIVRECLLALEPDLYESDIEYRVDQAFYKKCERIIKKHFGVEE